MSLKLRRMLQARHILAQFKLKPSQTRMFCSDTTKPVDKNNNRSNKVESNVSKYHEMYQQLDKLDFMTAAKILFSEPPKKKKFGIDFHLVQLFFACLPSLAVYLVAQYARHEMRKMDAELDQRKKKELEEKAKEMELKAQEEKAARSADLLEVKERLDKLEETVKEIVVEPKKQLGGNVTENQDSIEKKHIAQTTSSNADSGSESSQSSEKDHVSKQRSVEGAAGTVSTSISGASSQDQREKTQNGGTSEDAKR